MGRPSPEVDVEPAAPEPTRRTPSRLLPTGAVILEGRFRILSLLGSGGMGDVYLAEQVSLGRQVAVKALRSEMVIPGMTDRFRREARLLSTVDDPSVVRVIDFGDSQGAYFLVMEYVEGRTLRQALEEGPLASARALSILAQIAAGLEAIHARGIVHRDLKPDNIVLTQGARGEQARLLDFGLAKLAEPEAGAPSMTQAGFVLGTPEYLSPEQALGQQADCPSDVYSFGVLAYRLLSGKLPFPGPSSREFLMQHATMPVPELSVSAPQLAAFPELCRVVMACLSKEAKDRPSNGGALNTALTPLVAGSVVPVRRPSLVTAAVTGSLRPNLSALLQRGGHWLGRMSRRARLFTVAVLAVACGVAAVSWCGDRAAARARELLADNKPSDALALLEGGVSEGKPVRTQLKAVALHRLARHRDEWGELASLGRSGLASLEPAAVQALAADFVAYSGDPALLRALASLPDSASNAFVAVAHGPLSEEQWGALRYLDSIRPEHPDLVGLYIASLKATDCKVVAAAAQRLGELGDERAMAPLEEVRSSPRKPGFLFDRSCGHDEASDALRKLKRKEAR